MKTLNLFFVFFFVLLISGCSENSITDPVSSEINGKPYISGNTHSGTLMLNHILVVQGLGNSYYSLEGTIDFVHKFIQQDALPPAASQYINLDLNISAKLSDFNLPGQSSWKISSESNDIIYNINDIIYVLEKVYSVQGNEKLNLICRFIISMDGIELNEIWLANQEKIYQDTRSDQIPLEIYPPVKKKKLVW
jgi:hypothetical protein